MVALLRLDKFLAVGGKYSRSQVVRLVREGTVQVDGVIIRDPAHKINPEQNHVLLCGEPVMDERQQYLILHKPDGILTAARDKRASTVMDLLPEAYLRRNVLPVGRLDKDTTGVLLLTNDGALAHRLLSPRRHIMKEYHCWVEGMLDAEDVQDFAVGLCLSDFTALPAELHILSACSTQSQALLYLQEGKFHQVKRMFASRGHPVQKLHRTAFGPLRLPSDLLPGNYRSLTAEEITALRNAT